jgi:LuxR family maltose regulon positive regulatory protein
MPDPLVETKLLLPRPRQQAVPRPRLAALLAAAREAPVTLVSAPPGFGKTTLLSTWLAPDAPGGADRPVAWVSLDERDRHGRLWTYLLLAIDRAVPGTATAALTLLQSGQASVETVLAGVVNELSVTTDEVTVVLDDYHLVDGPEVAEGMAFLVDHLPPQLHLVVSSRADPRLPLARLRARGELVEIRAAELRFTGEEVFAYLNDLHGLDLAASAVRALETRTEGWAAALQLAALSLRDRADTAGFIDRFAGDDRFVVDYLVDEVLDRQPDDVRRFLLDTSVLDTMTASLCDAVSPPGDADVEQPRGRGRAMLDLLDRQNLFLVPLDDHRRLYRYHHLFGDVIRAHLLQERPGDVAGLHRRASRWYAEAQQPEDAVRQALAAGDVDVAADLAERAIHELGRHRRESVIRRWVDELPDEVVAHRPVLAIGLIGGLMASNEFEGVDQRLREVEAMLDEPSSELVVLDQHELSAVPARIEMYRSALALVGGDSSEAIRRARAAITDAPEGDDFTVAAASSLAGLAHWASGELAEAHEGYVAAADGLTRVGRIADVLGCSLTLADLELALGRLRAAERTLEGGLELAGRHRPAGGEGPGVLRGTADMLVALSRAAWHRNDLTAAADLLRRADDLGESAGLPQNPYRWRVAMARLRVAERDWAAALELLDEAERVYVGDFSPPVHPIHASRARVLAASGDLSGALAWARTHRLDAADELSYLREFEHVTLARILLAEHGATGDADALMSATGLLDRLLEAAVGGDRDGTVIEIEVLRAQAAHAAGDETAAVDAIEHAVDLAEPDGWLRFFVGGPRAIAETLQVLASSRPRSGFVRDLIGAVVVLPGEADVGIGSPVRDVAAYRGADGRERPSLVDPLSERELEVLRLLGSDLDGPGIARHLVVSLNTVRTHTKHIYTKLGVNNRRSAISRAHQLGLLSRSGRDHQGPHQMM